MTGNTYRFTKKDRQSICLHEAGHAVMRALGGDCIFRLAVAPEGATEWSVEGRKGGMSMDLWGMCEASDTHAYAFMKWIEGEGSYAANKKMADETFAQFLGGLSAFRTTVRANICGLLAGQVAESIHRHEEVDLYEGDRSQNEDITKALGLSGLLHWRCEYEYLAELTEQTLRRPDVWAMVKRLADELERQGDMREFDGLLPKAISRAHWPPSPVSKAAANASSFTLEKGAA